MVLFHSLISISRAEAMGRRTGDTLISRLESNGITQFRNSPRSHSSSESRSLSLSPVSKNKSGLSPRPHPIISLPSSKLSRRVDQYRTYRSQKAGSWSVHPPEKQSAGTQNGQIARLISFLEDHSIVQQSIVEACWCREPQHTSLDYAQILMS